MPLAHASGLLALALLLAQQQVSLTGAISIKPADFERLIMPCYLGGSSPAYSSPLSPVSAYQANAPPGNGMFAGQSSAQGAQVGQVGQVNQMGQMPQMGRPVASGAQPSAYQSGAFYSGGSGLANGPAGNNGYSSSSQSRDLYGQLGQSVPRAATMDNFIALLTKIEVANPRLASQPDQLIRMLLGRFRLDNFYYDVRSRTHVGDQDRRTGDILPALLNAGAAGGGQMMSQAQYVMSSDAFPEHLLSGEEKCSMYFMLSHFIDKFSPQSSSLASQPFSQLTGAQGNQRPPVLQAAGTGYPAQSANAAFSANQQAGAGAGRYPGPSPSFGSPATGGMSSFGAGLSNQPDSARNSLGMNVAQPPINGYNNPMRNLGPYSGNLASNSRLPSAVYMDGQARARDERQATEFGVVTLAGQDNSAIVLNRVLMGILAASQPAQSIRLLAGAIYPVPPSTNSAKVEEDIDPLFASTLADLWAISAIPKPGKALEFGTGGRWNDTMCPTSFRLNPSSSSRFTQAELLGGLDGFGLGQLRRRLFQLNKSLRLSELLRMYYSKSGFRPQFAEVGVCNRASALASQLDDLHRQAENYLRLYQLNLPTSDMEIANSINKVDGFKNFLLQAANNYAPADICADSSASQDIYSSGPNDQCEIAKADVVLVLDSSVQANEPFMSLVASKLAQRLGLARAGSSISILTNQQDSSGYASSFSFNAIVRNSSNTAEIGCALVHDTTRMAQGGQVNEPTRLVEMFERALVNLDSEYLVRQSSQANQNGGSSYSYSYSYSSDRPSSYVSSLFNQQANMDGSYFGLERPQSTGGAKVIVWFNYATQMRHSPVGAAPTNWNANQNGNQISEKDSYRFYEAKKYLRENFRGAAVLALAPSKDQVKQFVYNEDRDIFTDIPPADGGATSALNGPSGSASSDYYNLGSSSSGSFASALSDPNTLAALSGQADQLVGRLLQRMCDVPALFQYPMCFRGPSEGASSSGYISPGRRQHWMMAPKTFFASRAVRLAFKVEGGRLRVCFGRMARPDESYNRNADRQQQQPYQSMQMQPQQQQQQPGGLVIGDSAAAAARPSSFGYSSGLSSVSSSDYYTGLEYGVCKDVSPGQEIDFLISDPCYKKSIAECEPFYFVINELSQPGDGDPNYMCRDEGCRRFDQAKFTLTHSGVVCSSAGRVGASLPLMLTALFAALLVVPQGGLLVGRLSTGRAGVLMAFLAGLALLAQQVGGQQAGVHDFGEGKHGERRGNYTPYEVLAIILLIMTILGGLALTIALCYYVAKRSSRGTHSRVDTEEP